MKLWVKITMIAQALVIVFFMLYSYILANEATKMFGLAEEKKKEALAFQLEAEKQAEIAERNLAQAYKAMNEAAEQAKIAQDAQNEIAALKKALARCR